jgi:hypothetical protein
LNVQPSPRDPVEFRLLRGNGSIVIGRRGRHRLTIRVRVPQGSYRLVVAKRAKAAPLSYRIDVSAPQAAGTTQ